MSQATIEAGIIDTITQHADFDSDNTKLYDRRPMGKGKARVVVVSYNSHRKEQVTLKIERRIWIYNVDVMVPWRGDLTELDTRVGTETQKVIDTLAKYPKLNGVAGIQRTDVTLANTPDLIQEKKGGYRGKRHFLDVREIVDPGRVE
jgi:hypothetical protein